MKNQKDPTHKRIPITPAQIEKMVALRKEGKTYKAIGAEMGLSLSVAYKHLRKNRDLAEEPFHKRIPVTPEQIEQMVALRKEGKTYEAIAAEVGLSTSTVYKHLQESRDLAEDPLRRRTVVTPAVMEQMVALRKEGKTYKIIAAELNLHKRTISRKLKNYSLKQGVTIRKIQ